MIKINIKPLSVNEAWKGRRFKTEKYTDYEKELFYLLPPLILPEGNLMIDIEWGFSNINSDIDNPVKPFLDILQKKYEINDKRIYKMAQSKKIVKKGSEYIWFELSAYK